MWGIIIIVCMFLWRGGGPPILAGCFAGALYVSHLSEYFYRGHDDIIAGTTYTVKLEEGSI